MIALAIGVLALSTDDPEPRLDRSGWTSERGTPCDARVLRQTMVSDVTEHQLQIGMTERDVLRVLGAPDRRGNRTQETTGWDYDLGPSESDCVFLYVGFDAEGRLREWHTAPDY